MYEFNEHNVCTNPDRLFAYVENKNYPYKGNYAIIKYAQLPNGKWVQGVSYWIEDEGGITPVKPSYNILWDKKEDAINDGMNYILRIIEKKRKNNFITNEDGSRRDCTPTLDLMEKKIREKVEDFLYPSLF